MDVIRLKFEEFRAQSKYRLTFEQTCLYLWQGDPLNVIASAAHVSTEHMSYVDKKFFRALFPMNRHKRFNLHRRKQKIALLKRKIPSRMGVLAAAAQEHALSVEAVVHPSADFRQLHVSETELLIAGKICSQHTVTNLYKPHLARIYFRHSVVRAHDIETIVLQIEDKPLRRLFVPIEEVLKRSLGRKSDAPSDKFALSIRLDTKTTPREKFSINSSQWEDRWDLFESEPAAV